MSATVEKSVAGPVDRSLSKSDMSTVLATNREAGQLSQCLNIKLDFEFLSGLVTGKLLFTSIYHNSHLRAGVQDARKNVIGQL